MVMWVWTLECLDRVYLNSMPSLTRQDPDRPPHPAVDHCADSAAGHQPAYGHPVPSLRPGRQPRVPQARHRDHPLARPSHRGQRGKELGRFGLVPEISAQVRVHRAAPLFKLYLINNDEAFFGFYPVREHVLSLGGQPQAIYDLMGKDAILFHHSVTDDDSLTGSQYVDQARTWFDSMWNTVSADFTR